MSICNRIHFQYEKLLLDFWCLVSKLLFLKSFRVVLFYLWRNRIFEKLHKNDTNNVKHHKKQLTITFRQIVHMPVGNDHDTFLLHAPLVEFIQITGQIQNFRFILIFRQHGSNEFVFFYAQKVVYFNIFILFHFCKFKILSEKI